MKQAVVGSLLTAVAVFAWGFLFWSTVAPISFPAEDTELREVLLKSLPATGVYFVPVPEGATYKADHEAGPLVQIFFRREGAPVMAPKLFVFGFLHNFVTALILSFLLAFAGAYGATYGRRVTIVVVAGLAAAVWTHFGQVIWFYHDGMHHLAVLCYDVIAFLIGGLILGRFIRSAAGNS